MDTLQKDIVETMLNDVETVFRMRDLTDEDIAKVWNGIEVWCLYSLLEKKGRFFQMVEKAKRDARDMD